MLIPQVFPRSKRPIDSKGYCTVPEVKVILKTFSCTRGCWMGSRVSLISVFWSPKWVRLIDFLLAEALPQTALWHACWRWFWKCKSAKTGDWSWGSVSYSTQSAAGSAGSGLSPNTTGMGCTCGGGIPAVGCPVVEHWLCAKPPPSTDPLFSCK